MKITPMIIITLSLLIGGPDAGARPAPGGQRGDQGGPYVICMCIYIYMYIYIYIYVYMYIGNVINKNIVKHMR